MASSPTADPLPEPSRLPTILRALRHRNYRLFFIGQLISLIGTWMQTVAQAWLVYRLTGSSVWLGAIGFASQIPVFLLAPVGGAFADRHDRRRILVATQAGSMLPAYVLAAQTFTGAVQAWHVLALTTLLGLIMAIDIPARQAFLFDMVEREDLLNAIALNSSIVNGARIIGPAIAGLLVAAIGEGWCFLLNGLSFLAVIAGLLAMRLPPRAPARAEPALSEIREGFRYAAHTVPVRALLLVVGLNSLMGLPYLVLLPVFADQIHHGGPTGLGLLMGASGVGALAAAVTLAARRGTRGLGRWVAFASAGLGASLILFAFARSFWLAAAFLVPVGFSTIVLMAASNTLIQMMVPDRLRGRLMALYSMMFIGMAPFGSLLAGLLARYLGAPATVALGGAACIAGAALFGWHLPALAAAGRQLILAQQAASGEPAAVGTTGEIPAAAGPTQQRTA